MNRSITLKDLEQKMQDGRTLFDFLVESDNRVIESLFYRPFYDSKPDVAQTLDSLASLVQAGAKPANIYKVLRLHGLSNSSNRAGHIGFILAHFRNTALSTAMLTKYIALLSKFFTDGVLTDEELINILKITATVDKRKDATMGEAIILNNDEVRVKEFLDLLELVRYQSKDVLDILEKMPLTARKLPLSEQTKKKFNQLYMSCLFDVLNNNQLAINDLPKYITQQAAVLDHVETNLPANERLAALRRILDPKSQLGQFFLISKDKKAASIKREHGLLFRALRIYSRCASQEPEDGDADFCFEQAVLLDQLIKNKRSRSADVLSVLMKLLTNSLANVVIRPDRIKEIYKLLMPNDKTAVTLRELVVNADSPVITKAYTQMLTDLLNHGMKATEVVDIIEEPMQHIYRNNARLVDLVARHNNGSLKNQLITLLATCKRKDERVDRRTTAIMTLPILSIGRVYSSITATTILSSSGSGSVDEVFDYVLPKVKSPQPRQAQHNHVRRPVEREQKQVERLVASLNSAPAPAVQPAQQVVPLQPLPIAMHYPALDGNQAAPTADALPPAYHTIRRQQPAAQPPLSSGFQYVPEAYMQQPVLMAHPNMQQPVFITNPGMPPQPSAPMGTTQIFAGLQVLAPQQPQPQQFNYPDPLGQPAPQGEMDTVAFWLGQAPAVLQPQQPQQGRPNAEQEQKRYAAPMY
jgi:hypothetical protein